MPHVLRDRRPEPHEDVLGWVNEQRHVRAELHEAVLVVVPIPLRAQRVVAIAVADRGAREERPQPAERDVHAEARGDAERGRGGRGLRAGHLVEGDARVVGHARAEAEGDVIRHEAVEARREPDAPRRGVRPAVAGAHGVRREITPERDLPSLAEALAGARRGRAHARRRRLPSEPSAEEHLGPAVDALAAEPRAARRGAEIVGDVGAQPEEEVRHDVEQDRQGRAHPRAVLARHRRSAARDEDRLGGADPLGSEREPRVERHRPAQREVVADAQASAEARALGLGDRAVRELAPFIRVRGVERQPERQVPHDEPVDAGPDRQRERRRARGRPRRRRDPQRRLVGHDRLPAVPEPRPLRLRPREGREGEERQRAE